MCIDRLKNEFGYLRGKDWPISEAGRFWDSVVGYDDLNAKTCAHGRRFKDALQLLEFNKGDAILDFCCRSGDAIIYLSNITSIDDKKIICADISKKFLELTSERLKNLNNRFKTSLITEYKLPFDDSSFDIVFCLETIEHFSKPRQIIGEISRVLKKGGQLTITTPNIAWEPIHMIASIFGMHHSEGPHSFLPRGNIIKAIKDADLEIVKELTAVLLPYGPKSMTDFFERLEKRIPENIMRILALRRIFFCRKNG